MTEQEFRDLQRHDRIKYIGKTRPLKEQHRWSVPGNKIPIEDKIYNAIKKGVVVVQAGGFLYSGKETFSLSIWGYDIYGMDILPEDWEIVKRRGWISDRTAEKRARTTIKNELGNLKEDISSTIRTIKYGIEGALKGISSHKKLEIIMELTPEQKNLFELVHTDTNDVIKYLLKGVEENRFAEETNDKG